MKSTITVFLQEAEQALNYAFLTSPSSPLISNDRTTSLTMLVLGTGARTTADPSSSPLSPVRLDLRLLPKPTQEEDSLSPSATGNSITTAEEESIICTHSTQEMRNLASARI